MLDDIYEAAVDAERWPVALRNLTKAADAHGAMFAALSVKASERSFLTTHGMDDALTPVFLQRHQVNPWTHVVLRTPGNPVHPRLMAALPGLHSTDFFGEVLAPQRIVSTAAVALNLGSDFDVGGFGLYFDAGWEAAEERGVALLEVLTPHLQRAVRTNVRLQQTTDLTATSSTRSTACPPPRYSSTPTPTSPLPTPARAACLPRPTACARCTTASPHRAPPTRSTCGG